MHLRAYFTARARAARQFVHEGSPIAGLLDDLIEFFNRFPEVPMSEREKGRQVPTVSRNVHYLARGSADGVFAVAEVRAAIITAVDDDGNPESAVSLAVLNPSGLFFNHHVPFGDGPGCWRWPPYVPPVPFSPPRASTGESVAAGSSASGAGAEGNGGASASGEGSPRSLGAAAGTPTLREWLMRIRDFRGGVPPARLYANTVLQLLDHVDELRTVRENLRGLECVGPESQLAALTDRIDLLLGHLDALRECERVAGCYVAEDVEASAVALGAEPRAQLQPEDVDLVTRDGQPIALVLTESGREKVLRQFAPLDPLHPVLGLPCLRCHVPFKAGDRTLLVEDPQGERVGVRVEAMLVHLDCDRAAADRFPVTHAIGRDAHAAAAEHARKIAGILTETPMRLHLGDEEKNP